MVVQEDDDKRKYEGQMADLIAEKDELLKKRNKEFQRLKKIKQELEMTSHSGYTQIQGRNEKMLEDIEALYEKKLALENKKYFELENVFEK